MILDPLEIINTTSTLRTRIEERFPDSGLKEVCRRLEETAKDAKAVSEYIRRPYWGYRLTVSVVFLGCLYAVVHLLAKANVRSDFGGISDYIQGIQATAQMMAYTGAIIFFLSSLEIRLKRKRVLGALHTLRSFAHVVDMHQLTKDPERLCNGSHDTKSSPKRTMTPFELKRYLTYCSEMLAIISKIATIYVQDFHDADAVDATSDIEDLTGGLTRSVWHKIIEVDRTAAACEIK